MQKSYAQLQQSLTFDKMMETLDEKFQTIPDKRTGHAVKYRLSDVLKAAFARFSLKSPSLLDFKTQTTAEEKNLHNIRILIGVNESLDRFPVNSRLASNGAERHSRRS